MAVKITYANVSWHPSDVQSLRPNWSLKKCEEELSKNAKYIQERMVELGWEVIEDLLDQ